MAIGHIAVRAHSRANGHSAAAALAYRFGLALTCSRTGERHDFSRRGQGDDIVACDLTPGPFRDGRRARHRHRGRRAPEELPAAAGRADRATRRARRRSPDHARRALRRRPSPRATGPSRLGQSTAPTGAAMRGTTTRILSSPRAASTSTGSSGRRSGASTTASAAPRRSRRSVRYGRPGRTRLCTQPASTSASTLDGRRTPSPRSAPPTPPSSAAPWSQRHRGRTPPAMSAAQLVLDDGPVRDRTRPTTGAPRSAPSLP